METREDITVRIKESADIVQLIGENVELRKSGARFLGLCPFHGEKTPSFTVHPGNQFFHCFGCGESGDVFSFMMKYHNVDFPEAIKQLAKRYDIPLPERKVSSAQKKEQQLRQTMFSVNKKAAELFTTCLEQSSHAQEAREYLKKRGIPIKIQQQFGLGYAPSQKTAGWDFLGSQLSNDEKTAAFETGLLAKKEKGGSYDRFSDRVLFPIYDISGQVCGFGGRIVGEGQPKYMNSPESPVYNKSRSLLGLFQDKDAIRVKDQVVIVEGNFDLISLVVHGCENVVAPLGTALTREQVRMLKRFASEGILLFDGDSAGVKAAVRAVPFFLAEQMKGKVALLPSGHDPDTYVQEFGLVALEKLLENAQELSEFVLSHLVEQHGMTMEGKTKIVEELRPLVRSASSSLQRSVVIAHFAGKLGLSTDELNSLLKKDFSEPQEEQIPIPSEYHEPFGMEEQMSGHMLTQQEFVAPLTPPQKRLVNYMIFHPEKHEELTDAGIRDELAGGMGEIIYLQIKALVEKRGNIQPEELLSALPHGAERTLVADMLLSAPIIDSENQDGRADEIDCLNYLRSSRLKQKSQKLLVKISEAQSRGDFEQLQRFLIEKQEIDRKLQGDGLS